MNRDQICARMGEVGAELAKLTCYDRPTTSQLMRAQALGAEFDGLEAELRSGTLQEIRSAASGGAMARDSGLTVVPGAFGGTGSDYDRDALREPDSIEDFRGRRDPWNTSDLQRWGRSPESIGSELRARALAAIEKMSSCSDAVREASTRIVERFDDKHATLARVALAASSPQYLRAFSKAATNRQHEMTTDELRALQEVRALSLTDSAGGYLVPFQLDPTVIVTANGSRNDIRKIARQVVATGDTWNGVSAGAVSWSWDAEATQVSDDAPTFAQPSIPVYKAAGFVPVSLEAFADMANGAQEVANLLAFGRETLEAAAFAVGSGVGQPQGVVTGLVGTSSIVSSATTDTLAVGDLYTIQGALPARFRANASWLGTNAFYNRARQFDTAGGSSLWAQLGDDRPPLLLGRPVYEAEDMDGVINATAENYMAVFGDFQQGVTIADRIGMTIEFIPHLFGTANGRPTGQRGWYAYYRTGSAVLNPSALRLLNIT